MLQHSTGTDTHTQTHTHTDTHTYQHTHTHTPLNVLSSMAEYIHCKLSYVRKHVNAPIKIYTIHTRYQCIIHILLSKSMFPSRSCKTATSL